MTKTRYLLGATEDREIVFGEFGIITRNGYPEFTASFNIVSPFTADDLEDGAEYYQHLLDDCYSDEDKYRMCEEYNCRPSELAEHLADENGTDPQDMRDCSLYPEIIDVDGTDWYFDSVGCGQHDTRDEMAVYTNQDAYNMLHTLWDKYHLKEVDVGVMQTVDQLDAQLTDVDEIDWIANYIRENF